MRMNELEEKEYLDLIKELFFKLNFEGEIKKSAIINQIDTKFKIKDADLLEEYKKKNTILLNYTNPKYNIDYKIALAKKKNEANCYIKNNSNGNEMLLGVFYGFKELRMNPFIIIRSNNIKVKFYAVNPYVVADKFASISDSDKFTQVELVLINQLITKLLETIENNDLISKNTHVRRRENKSTSIR